MSDSEQLPQAALSALNQAALAVVSNLDLENVLRQIVESARALANARYAALGIPGRSGKLIRFIHSGMDAETATKIGELPVGRGLLGAILEEGRTIRIPHIGDDPRSVGFPPHHPPMSSFLGVPIRIGDEIVGNMYLTEKMGGREFTKDDEEIIELLGAHAAIAIQNARLYEQVGRLAIVEERSRIGMDLHDGVIQSIYAVGLGLESARLQLEEAQHPQVVKTLEEAIEGLNEAIRDIRNFILDLRPRRFEGDLGQGLARLAREFQANTMVPVELHAPQEVISELPRALARDIFMTAQEALANIARHARASQVELLLARENEFVLLEVRDNGRGFRLGEEAQTTGHGLANMRSRAEERRGTFTVDSKPGQGTTLRLRLPLTGEH